MTIRSRQARLVFDQPFYVKSVQRMVPAGAYDVTMDDELLEGGGSMVGYRRVMTAVMIPGAPPHAAMIEMATVDPSEIAQGYVAPSP